jgi:protein-S-isoprenylcysteine O-methyltransferase Ste14
MRLVVLLFGAICYVIVLLTFLYQIGFVTESIVPKAINDGAPIEALAAIGINVLLLGVFAVQHTIMVRLTFKSW